MTDIEKNEHWFILSEREHDYKYRIINRFRNLFLSCEVDILGRSFLEITISNKDKQIKRHVNRDEINLSYVPVSVFVQIFYEKNIRLFTEDFINSI